MIDEIELDAQDRMEKSVLALKGQLAKIIEDGRSR